MRATFPAILAFLAITLVLLPLLNRPAPRSADVIPSTVPSGVGTIGETDPRPTGASDTAQSTAAATARPLSGTPQRSPVLSAKGRGVSAAATLKPSQPSPKAHRLPPPPASARPRPPAHRPAAMGGGHSIAGQATWFCLAGRSACTAGYDPRCTCAAAGAELQVGKWRGRIVTVSTRRVSVAVRLVDSCACPGAHLIDLFSSVYSQLGPLTSGELDVVVSWR